MKQLLLFLISIFFISCVAQPKPQPKTKQHVEIDWCVKGCNHVEFMGCEEGKDLVYSGSCDSSSECIVGACIKGMCKSTCVERCRVRVQKEHLDMRCWYSVDSCQTIALQCKI